MALSKDYCVEKKTWKPWKPVSMARETQNMQLWGFEIILGWGVSWYYDRRDKCIWMFASIESIIVTLIVRILKYGSDKPFLMDDGRWPLFDLVAEKEEQGERECTKETQTHVRTRKELLMKREEGGGDADGEQEAAAARNDVIRGLACKKMRVEVGQQVGWGWSSNRLY